MTKQQINNLYEILGEMTLAIEKQNFDDIKDLVRDARSLLTLIQPKWGILHPEAPHASRTEG